MRKTIFYFMLVLCLGVTVYAFYGYFVLQPGSTVAPAMKAVYQEHKARILLHVFFAGVALLAGPFQFIPAIRRRRSLHRRIGYVYFVAVFAGGAAGLAMAFISDGGTTAHFGFGLLALIWLYSGYRALSAIREKDYLAHEAWAIRSFALTFAAVTLRIYLGVFSAAGLPFEEFYPAVSWLCWVPNLLIAEWLLLPALMRSKTPSSPVQARPNP